MKSHLKSPRGRPPALDSKLQKKICETLRNGNYLEPAAILNGVSKVSVYAWLKRGAAERKRLEKDKDAKVKRSEKRYFDFINAVEKAQASAETIDIQTIREASKTQWQAAAWRLERKNYKRWGRKQAIEHTGEDGGPIEIKQKQSIKVGGKLIEF